MFRIKVAVSVILVSSVIGFGTWAFCQMDLAWEFFKMVCVPILVALFLARGIWATFFATEAKDQALALAQILSGGANKIEGFTTDFADGKKRQPQEWDEVVNLNIGSPSQLANMVQTEWD